MATKTKSSEPAEVPRLADVEALARPAAEEAGQIRSIAEALSITTPAEAEFAAGALREVAQRRDQLDAQRKRWVEPLKRVSKEIDEAFRPAIRSLEAAETAIKTALGRYALAAEARRAEALREAAALARAGDHAEASAAIEAASADVVDLAGVSVREEWTGEVVDAAALPREYMRPDTAKLEATTKALGADPGIPGWRAFQVEKVRTSRRADS